MTSKGDKLAKAYHEHDYDRGRSWDKPCSTISEAMLLAESRKPGQLIMVHPGNWTHKKDKEREDET